MKDYRHRVTHIGRRNFKDDWEESEGVVAHPDTARVRELTFQQDTRALPRHDTQHRLFLERLDVDSDDKVSSASKEDMFPTSFVMKSPVLKRKSKSNLKLSEDDSTVGSSRTVLSPKQSDYDALVAKLRETEERAEASAAQNSEEIHRIEKAYQHLTAEHASVLAEVRSKEESMERSVGAESAALLEEKLALEKRLQQMESEMSEAYETLRRSEEKAKCEARQLQEQLSQDKKLLQRSLEMLEEEKNELARKLEEMLYRQSQQEELLTLRLEAERAKFHSAIVKEASDVQRQKDDLARVLQEIEAEKELLRLQSETAKQELLNSQKLNEQKLSAEKSKLEAALGSLRAENQQMTDRLRKEHEEWLARVELERAEKEKELTRLRIEREEVEVKQKEAAQKLEDEKRELLSIIGNMKRENSRLAQQVASSSVNYELTLQQQRNEYNRNIERMEADKSQLESLVRQIENSTNESSESYHRSKEEMSRALKAMEEERASLTLSLQKLQQTTQEQSRVMEEHLRRERDELLEKMSKAEEEKKIMAEALLEKERIAAEKLLEISKRLDDENATRTRREEAAVAAEMEREKRERQEASLQAERLAKEMADIEREKASVAAERTRLEQLARETELRVKEREEAAAASITKEREELIALVQKMKADFLAEKHSYSPGKELTPKSSQKVLGSRLNTKTSLFNLLENVVEEEVMDKGVNSVEEVSEADNYDHEKRLSVKEDYSYLSAPHAIAASGNMKLLLEMEQEEPYLLCSLDEASRSPLFYASANDRLEVVDYLCKLWPESATYKDIHGDTPLHAAASAGSSRCVRALLSFSEFQSENNMGMTAVTCVMIGFTVAHLSIGSHGPER